MQFKLSALTAFALATLAVATPLKRDECSTGPIQCCNSVVPASSPAATSIFALLGIVVQDLTVAVGLTCTPISVIGVGGDSCTSQPVCCTNNSFNGLVAIGCTPINVSL